MSQQQHWQHLLPLFGSKPHYMIEAVGFIAVAAEATADVAVRVGLYIGLYI